MIGVGTGSTVQIVIEDLARRVKEEGLALQVVTTSFDSRVRCQEAGLTVLDASYRGSIAWAFDGADEVERGTLNVIKGAGGAMFEEKIVASRAQSFVVIIEARKLVDKLGGVAIPIEVYPAALPIVERDLKELGAREFKIRNGMPGVYGPARSGDGNLLMDAFFSNIDRALEKRIKQIVGVIESGLFAGYTSEVVVGMDDGRVEYLKAQPSRS